jgi:hypothetical protein
MKIWLTRTFKQAAWAPLIVFVFYAVAEKGFNAYILYPWVDTPTHFFGGVAITYFFSVGTVHAQEIVGRIHPVIRIFLSLGLTAIIAVVWEFLEYLSDIALDTKLNLGVSDTLSDLFFGLLGGTIAISLIWIVDRNQVRRVVRS